jgi:hypothetical protein
MKLLFPLLMSVLPGASVTQSQPSPQAPPDNFNLPFVLSVIGALITSFVVAKLYVWPALRWLPRYNSLRILASLHAFRFLGMNFVVVGFVSPALGSAVGNQIAWGDFIAAVLALFSIAVLTWRWAFAIPIVCDTAHHPHTCLHAAFEARRRCGTKREFTVAQGFGVPLSSEPKRTLSPFLNGIGRDSPSVT